MRTSMTHEEHLIVEPDDGVAPILNAIRHAKNTIDLTIFRFDRADVTSAIEAAVTRGVQVRALIAFSNDSGTAGLRRLEWRLLAAGAIVSRTSHDFPRYHAKLMIIDNHALHVCAFNYTRADVHSRSFGIITTNSRLVRQGIKLFEADQAHRPYDGGPEGLVVSPENARERLEAFLQGARHEILIYDSKLTDTRVLRLLDEQARAGVDVRVIGHVGKHVDLPSQRLHHRRLHLRAIIRDGTMAFVGSQSLRKPELDARREVGVFVHSPVIVRQIQDTFARDWPADTKSIRDVERAGLPLGTRDST